MRSLRKRKASTDTIYNPQAQIEHLLQQPVFRILSIDRLSWINPYTGHFVSAPFDFREAARKVLLRDRPWEHGRHPLSQQRLHALRWQHFLRQNIRQEQRLRYFHPNGEWLNPFNGKWERGVKRVNNKVGVSTIEQMALVLINCQSAGNGADMMSDQELKNIYLKSQQIEAEVTARLHETTTRHRPTTVSAPTVPSAAGAPNVETGAFGWGDLFGSDSPFDATPIRNQLATNETMDAHRLLTESGIDWAIHPGFDRGRQGNFVALQATSDGSICVLVGQILNAGNRGVDLVARLRAELRFLCNKVTGFVHILEKLTDFVYDELGDGSPLVGYLALIDPRDHSMDSLTMGTVPAIGFTNHGTVEAQRLGGAAPPMGSLPWDEYRKVITPTITKLLHSGTIFAMHQDGFRVKNQRGHILNQNQIWQLVGQLCNEHPRVVLARVLVLLSGHTGQPIKASLPHVGLFAMHVRR